MEYGTATLQKAADLVSQYDHFFAAVKERATSFTVNAASVNRSIEADFEALRVMLERRKNLLRSEVREEINASRENDIFELEVKQRNMHSSLQQLQKLAVQGTLSEDNKYYQQLLSDLSEAKHKLKETSDKFQIKYEGNTKPLATKIANYGQVVSGRGRAGNESKQKVDFNQVFAALSSQFESCCQVEYGDEQSPLSGWFEYSKKLQWRRTATIPSSEPAVPDFTSVIKKMKDDFNNHTGHYHIDNGSLEKWLVPRGAQQQSEWLVTSNKMDTPGEAVTRGFDAIARSDSSLWLLHSTSNDGLLSEHHGHFIADASPWLLQSSSTERQARPSMTSVASEQDYSEWLNPVMEVEKCQPWLTTTIPIKEDDVSNWLQGHNWSDQCNEQWLSPRAGTTSLPSAGDSGSDAFDNTQTLTSFASSDFELVDDTDL